MKHTSPLSSAAHQAFLQLASTAFDRQTVREFLWMMNAHDQLLAFVGVCRNLHEILELMCRLPGFSLQEHGITEWPALTQWVIDHRSALVTADPKADFDRQPTGPGDHPILGRGATRHGLYAALWCRHENEELQELFSRVIGHFLLSHIQLMRDYVPLESYEQYDGQRELPDFPNSPYPASLCIRALSKQDAEPALRLLNPSLPPETFAAELSDGGFSRPELRKRLTEDGYAAAVTGQTINSLSNFASFLSKAHGMKRWRTRSGGRGSGGSQWLRGHVGYPSFSFDAGDADDPKNDWGTMTVIQGPTPGGEEALKAILRGVDDDEEDPSDLTDENELTFSDFGDDASANGLAGLATAARGQARHIRMANQLLPWQYDTLTMTEVATLMSFLSQRFRALPPKRYWSREDTLVAECIALLHIMLWTGSPLERARDLEIIATENQSCALGLYRQGIDRQEKADSEIREWRVRGYFPEYKTRITAPQAIVRKRTQYAWLPDVAGGSRFIDALIDPDQPVDLRVFPRRNIKTHRDTIRGLLHEVDPTLRLTIGKLEKFLFHRVVQVEGDVAEAALMTGQAHRLAQTRVFYCTPSVQRLRDAYIRAVEEVVHTVSQANGVSPRSWAARPEVANRHVGSRLCARTEAIGQAVKSIQKDLAETSQFKTLSQFCDYHNLFTFYSVLMIAYGVGFRAVSSPFIPSDQIDPETKLAALADKDGDDHNKSRLVWIPDIIFQQIRHYERHCQAFLSEQVHRFTTRRLEADGACLCFLVRDSSKEKSAILLEEVRPRTLKPLLQEYLPLPANAQRRFLRTELRDRGCPPEAVDALMGHWSLGEEPWGRFSSFPFRDHVRVVKQYLLPLMDELGWRPVASTLIASKGR